MCGLNCCLTAEHPEEAATLETLVGAVMSHPRKHTTLRILGIDDTAKLRFDVRLCQAGSSPQ